MADTMFNNALIDDRSPVNKILPNEEAIASLKPRPEDKKKKGFARFLFNVATSEKTRDFVMGAAISGGISTATRMGVLGAAGLMGASLLPATLIAAGSAGAAVGTYRLYKDYKAEKAAGTWEGWTFKKCAGSLLMGTMFSTFGGGASYMVMNHGDLIADYAGKVSGVVVDALRDAGVIDAASKTFGTVSHYVAAGMNWSFSGSTDFIARTSDKVIASVGTAVSAVTSYDYGATFASSVDAVKETLQGWGASGKSLIASVTNYDYGAAYNSSVETVKQTFKGWGNSIKTAFGFTSPEPAIVVAETPQLSPITSEDVLANVTGPTVQNDIVIPTQPTLSPLTSEDILAQGDIAPAEAEIVTPELTALPPLTSEDILAQSETPEVVADPFEPRVVKTSIVLADGTIISPEEQAIRAAEAAKAAEAAQVYVSARISDAFDAIAPINASTDPLMGAYVPELQAYPEVAFPATPYNAFDATKIYSVGEISQEVTAAIAPAAEAVDAVNIADAFAQLQQTAANPAIDAYIPELNIYPDTAFSYPNLPAADVNAVTIYTLGDTSPALDSPIDHAQGFVVAADVTPVLPAGTFAENFGDVFEGMDLSNRAERAVEAALNGTDQQRKDLAMNVLNGMGGFKKDPELAARMYQFLLEDTKPAAGERASQTHLQVVRDTAYLMFHGKGMDANPAAAKSLLEEIAPRSRVARDMLAEWNGERVQRAAATVARATAGATQGAGAGTGGLNCEFVSAGNRVVSGACVLDANSPLQVGDRITLTP